MTSSAANPVRAEQDNRHSDSDRNVFVCGREDKNEDVFPNLTAALTGDGLERVWQQCREATNAPKAQDVFHLVQGMRDQFLAVLEEVRDPEECENLTALFYAQTRCEWIIQNTRSAYQIASGNLDRAVHLQCGMLSSLLAALETCLHPGDTDALSRLLAQPVRRGEKEHSGSGPTNEERFANTGEVHLTPLPLDYDERIAQITALRDALRSTQNERDALENEIIQSRKTQSALQASFGTSDGAVIAHRFDDLQARLNALQEVFGDLEQTFVLANV